MIKSLRRKHLRIWSILMVVLPISIVSARLVRPKQPTDNLLQPVAAAPMRTIVNTAETDNYTVRLRKDNDTTWQLEWINKTVLTFPTAVIYKAPKAVSDVRAAMLIGRVEAKGTYRFLLPYGPAPINAATDHLIVYDFIHQQIIETINFRQ